MTSFIQKHRITSKNTFLHIFDEASTPKRACASCNLDELAAYRVKARVSDNSDSENDSGAELSSFVMSRMTPKSSLNTVCQFFPPTVTLSMDDTLLPSIGSQGHEIWVNESTRSCKPCAYFHRVDGCIDGTECKFCHLCAEGVYNRRRKEGAKAARKAKIALAALKRTQKKRGVNFRKRCGATPLGRETPVF